MKSSRVVFFLYLCLVLFSACSFLPPKHMNDSDVKSSVYRMVVKDLYDTYGRSAFGEYYDELISFTGSPKTFECIVPQEERLASTEVVDWDHDEGTGSGYNMYIVYYRVKVKEESYYALVELTEFRSGSTEWECIAVENTLAGIKAYVDAASELVDLL